MTLRVAIPTNAELLDDTVDFLAECGIRISRRSARSLSAPVAGVPDSMALFQRSADIPLKVEERTADLAVVGLDRYLESTPDGTETIILYADLGYGECQLMLAVPEAWIDVESVYDLADLSVAMREEGKELRVATKYPRLTSRFLYRHGMNYFSVVGSAGAMEAAPLMGYADVIADIVETGTTLRENRLKTLADGCVLESRAVLIGNLRSLSEDESKKETLRFVLELIEGRLNANDVYSVTANVQSETEHAVVAAVLQHPEIAGLQGPTVSRVYSKDGPPIAWYAVTVVVQRANLLKAVEDLRDIGASGITVSPAAYVFRDRSPSYEAFLEAAGRFEG